MKMDFYLKAKTATAIRTITTTTATIIAIFGEFFGLSAGGGVAPGAGAAAESPPDTVGIAPPSGEGGDTGDGSGAGTVAPAGGVAGGVGATGSGDGVGAGTGPSAGAPAFGSVGGVGWFGSIKSCFLGFIGLFHFRVLFILSQAERKLFYLS